MIRTAFREMGEGQRTWLRRLSTTASVAVLLYALYEALPRNPSCPQPAHPKPGVGYACDPTGPTYHHPALSLLLAACSVIALIAVRRLLADEAA
jgi:hypothetical protein